MRTSFVTLVAVALGVLLSGYTGLAQDRPQQRPQREAQIDAQRKPGHQDIDRALATCLAIDAQTIIQIAELARNQAQQDDVKQFAEMLQQEHKECLAHLKQIEPSVAPFVSERTPASANRGADAVTPRSLETQPQGQARLENQRPQQARDASGQVVRGNDPHGADQGNMLMLQIKKEVAEANVNTLKQELASKDKAEFDRCFVGYQVGAHMQMLDTLKVFQRYASPQLAEAINDASSKTQQHLQQAEKLLESLEGKLTTAEENRSPVSRQN
jgi:predicted outer membrane protein